MPIVRNTTYNLRRKVERYEDPYLHDLQPREVARCRECLSVYVDKHWEPSSRADQALSRAQSVVETLCPACMKIRDRMPGGIVTLSGAFVGKHFEEIANLIKHENSAAMDMNPLERVMDMQRTDSTVTVMTTNEKLAQRIGRAMFKAYDGVVEYKWSKGTKLARVNWRRDG